MKIVILGAGSVGLSLMEEFARHETEIILVNRSGKIEEPLPRGVSLLAADASSAKDILPLCAGASAIYHVAGAPYKLWPAALPPLMETALEAAKHSGATLVYLDNMSAYGDHEGRPLAEAYPYKAEGPLGKLRADLANRFTKACQSGEIRGVLARAPDIFGPHSLQASLGAQVFDNLIQDRPINLFGRPDMPHTYTYVRDVAKALYTLGTNDEAFGQVWHLPSPQPITQGQILDMLRDVAHQRVKAQFTSAKQLGFMSIFNSEFKEMKEFLYQYENPFVVNHSRFAVTFGERTTPLHQALFETLDWFKRRAGIARRYGY